MLVARASVVRARPLAYGACVALALGGLVGAGALWWQGAGAWGLLGVAVTLGAAAALGWWHLVALRERLVVTNKRVSVERGLLSRTSIEMLHRTIQEIEVRQTVVERLMGTGTITVSNSAEDGDEIEMRHVRGPDRLRAVIDAYRPL